MRGFRHRGDGEGCFCLGNMPKKRKNAIAHILAFISTMGLGGRDMEQFLLFLNNRIGTDHGSGA